MQTAVRKSVVKYLGRHLAIDVDAGILTVPEYERIMKVLKEMTLTCETQETESKPQLLTVEETAGMLGISKSQFRTLESEGQFPFCRRMVGAAVRYLNTDIIDYMRIGSIYNKEEHFENGKIA